MTTKHTPLITQCLKFSEHMKTNIKTEKQFDAVKFMRQQRDSMSEKLSKMTKTEIVDYFKNRQLETKIKPCA